MIPPTAGSTSAEAQADSLDRLSIATTQKKDLSAVLASAREHLGVSPCFSHSPLKILGALVKKMVLNPTEESAQILLELQQCYLPDNQKIPDSVAKLTNSADDVEAKFQLIAEIIRLVNWAEQPATVDSLQPFVRQLIIKHPDCSVGTVGHWYSSNGDVKRSLHAKPLYQTGLLSQAKEALQILQQIDRIEEQIKEKSDSKEKLHPFIQMAIDPTQQDAVQLGCELSELKELRSELKERLKGVIENDDAYDEIIRNRLKGLNVESLLIVINKYSRLSQIDGASDLELISPRSFGV